MDHFVRAGGVQALTAVLEGNEALPAHVRLAVAALDCLTRCGGAAACEAALGWWAPEPQPALDVAADAEAPAEPAAAEPLALAKGLDAEDTGMQEVRACMPEDFACNRP